MKRSIFSVLFAALLALAVSAAGKADMQFKSTSFDFGTIKSTGGQVTATYHFKNTGDAPLVIVNVTNGGCGCTRPVYPKEPIKPGQSGVIKINFNPSGRRGELNREVKVKTNGVKKRISLKFSGVIVP